MPKRSLCTTVGAEFCLILVAALVPLLSGQTNAQQPVGGGQSGLCHSVRSPGGGSCANSNLPAVQHNSTTIVSPTRLDVIQFDPSTLRSSLESTGLYNLVGLGTWNGQPVTLSNMPDYDNRLLVADINLYVLPSATNVLYVQVTNVLTTEGAYWSGTAFDDVTQTGVRITFPDSSLLTSGVSLSGNFANPGEILADGTSGTEVDTPLSTTPGFALTAMNSGLAISTTNGANNGFTSLSGIYGATRIRGGGVFQLTFAQSVDLTQLDFNKLTVESEYGLANQYILATPNPGLGTNALLVGSSEGASSVLLAYDGAWIATANNSFLHLSAGSLSGTGIAMPAFTYDAFAGKGTRTGTLTVAGISLTVTQAGTNYIGPGPGTTLVSSGLNGPNGVAVDILGDVYIADTGNQAIKEWSPSTQLVTTLVSSGLSSPTGVAVDGSGNVYIADSGNDAVYEWNAATQLMTTLVSGFPLSSPSGVAVDKFGNVYIADSSGIYELSASALLVAPLVSSGLSSPTGVAVDGSGNVYIADSGNDAVYEWNAATQLMTAVVPSGLSSPKGVVVDGADNVYIADDNNNAIKEITDAFVGPTNLTEPAAAGYDSLLSVLPYTRSLAGVFTPTSDQGWLTIGTIASGVISFSFTANPFTSVRTAHITVLGQQITVRQNGLTKSPTTTTLASSPNPSAYGQTLLLTATVTSPFGTPPDGETVTFKQGATVLGTGTLNGGSGTFSTSQLGVGDQRIIAAYLGDANFTGSKSEILSQVIPKATSTTKVIASQNPSVYGQPVTFTATVAPQFSGAPTGNVVFQDGTLRLATVALSGGIAIYTTSTLAEGTHSITVTYDGSSDFSGSAAALAEGFQVTLASQIITFGVISNQLLTTSQFMVTATASSGLTVKFYSRTTRVCTVSGITVTLLALGTCTIEARQGGNANYAAAAPVDESFQVQAAQIITFGALSKQPLGPPFTVSATASSGLTVKFQSQTKPVCTVFGTTVTLVTTGICTIQATQGGGPNYVAATPVDQSFQVTPQ